MMNSSYNAYSSGVSFFQSQSTSDANICRVVPMYRVIDAPNQGRYRIIDVADWFLSKESMTHKKLQKLCYYAQAWCYALNGYRLTDAVFEAWRNGPVCPALYDKFKGFGYSSIRIVGSCTANFVEKDMELLESVWETYGDHTGNALEALCMQESPWVEARAGCAQDEKRGKPISAESMKRYYASIYIGGDS